jgi:hypothetical protein
LPAGLLPPRYGTELYTSIAPRQSCSCAQPPKDLFPNHLLGDFGAMLQGNSTNDGKEGCVEHDGQTGSLEVFGLGAASSRVSDDRVHASRGLFAISHTILGFHRTTSGRPTSMASFASFSFDTTSIGCLELSLSMFARALC